MYVSFQFLLKQYSLIYKSLSLLLLDCIPHSVQSTLFISDFTPPKISKANLNSHNKQHLLFYTLKNQDSKNF